MHNELLKESLDHLYTLRNYLGDLPMIDVCIQYVALDKTISKIELELKGDIINIVSDI